MSRRSDDVYLGHMMDMCRIAHSLAADASRAELETDVKLQLALVRAISTIGEAARKVSVQFRDAHPAIRWPEIIAMRHKLVHDYFEIDLDVVWDAATADVPELLSSLEQLDLQP
jgi:uncharacterized protein with HEPN domain